MQTLQRKMGEDVLVTRNLTKKYRNNTIVDHISLSVKKGDIYALIGANGAGKTTFMRMICGLSRPSEGELELYGQANGKALRNARKKVGALFESAAIYPNMSAMENLEVQRRYLGIGGGKETANMLNELLELVGLKDTGRKKAGGFSVGMKQRLGLAVALTASPALLILDEPATDLELHEKEEFRNLLLQFNQEKGLTIFFSSHDLSETEQLATRYGFMNRGKLVKEIHAEDLERECGRQGIPTEKYFLNLITEGRMEERE